MEVGHQNSFQKEKESSTQLWEIKASPQKFSFSHFGEGEGEMRREKQITSSLLPIIAEKEVLLKTPSPSTALERFDGLYIRKPNGLVRK